jgi:purine-binding chemotaxis protein CheW
VPGSSSFVRGVFNHGGVVTPVIDLAARLGLGKSPVTRRTCLILVGAPYEEEVLPIGLLVDAVTDVVDVAITDIQPPPDFGTRARLDYLEGLTRTDDGFTVLLSVDRFFTANELLEVRGHARGEGAEAN